MGKYPKQDCVFCDYQGVILGKFQHAFVIEPLDPVTKGHKLVIPFVHVQDATDIPWLTGKVFEYASEVSLWTWGAANLITSIGPDATQSVMHLHVHVVPRKHNDGLKLPWTDQKKVVHPIERSTS